MQLFDYNPNCCLLDLLYSTMYKTLRLLMVLYAIEDQVVFSNLKEIKTINKD